MGGTSAASYFGYYDHASNSWTQDGNGVGTGGGTSDGTYLNPQTPMVDDIAAIQSLYGADDNTRSGDTVYGFNCNIAPTVRASFTPDAVGLTENSFTVDESQIYDFSKNSTPIFTIWDGGGDNDTLDCSGYAGDRVIDGYVGHQVIDLTPGHYSSVLGLTDNIGIAYGAKIENAIGRRRRRLDHWHQRVQPTGRWSGCRRHARRGRRRYLCRRQRHRDRR
jgi:hypothetical protein